MFSHSNLMELGSFRLESGNIRNEELIVTCRSTSCLYSEIEVSLKSPNSIIQALVPLPFFVLVGVVAWWCSEYKFMQLQIQSTRCPWIIVSFFITLIILWIKYNYFDVVKDSVTVIKDIGIQIKSTYKSGKQAVQFIDRKSIEDVIINEAITMNKVIFYLAILTRNSERKKQNLKLIPLFTSFHPRLEGLKPIYHSIRSILFNDDQERCPGQMVRHFNADKIN